MQQPERLEKIIEMLNELGQVDVISLANSFAVTEQTVRRDLATLCQRGLATRMHGGARRLASTASLSYEARRMNNIAAKSAIGKKSGRIDPRRELSHSQYWYHNRTSCNCAGRPSKPQSDHQQHQHYFHPAERQTELTYSSGRYGSAKRWGSCW